MRALLAALALAAPCHGAHPPAHYQHVVWIWMENKSYARIAGARDAPFLNSVARRCGSLTRYSQVASPSLPNYLAATSGSTWGLRKNVPPKTRQIPGQNLFSQAGDWNAFVESAPHSCPRADAGLYVVRHDPAVYYTRLRRECRRRVLPLSRLSPDRLPRFAFVTPNLCHDMHDCSVAQGDHWLAGFLPRLLTGRSYRSGTTAVFLVWDEGGIFGRRVPFIALAPSIRPGTQSGIDADHYSLLRTTEELLGLPLLGNARHATSLRRALGL